jgi:hypothetical protein
VTLQSILISTLKQIRIQLFTRADPDPASKNKKFLTLIYTRLADVASDGRQPQLRDPEQGDGQAGGRTHASHPKAGLAIKNPPKKPHPKKPKKPPKKPTKNGFFGFFLLF